MRWPVSNIFFKKFSMWMRVLDTVPCGKDDTEHQNSNESLKII